ncbi:phage major capsid protein [Streptomyces hainanensis]|nr:phage major capsid protein [Streptomyces hainanensis]
MFTTGNPGLLPPEYGQLITEPMTQMSVAMQVATVVTTGANEFHFPRVNSDITAAWTAEGAAIASSDVATDAYVVVPKKLASLTTVTNELVNDSSPAAQEIVGQSIAREMARKLDAAFFGNLSAPAPAGLGSLAGTLVVDTGATITNADPFIDGQMEIEASGGVLTAWVASPATARAIAKIKEASGSNRPLVTPDVSAPSGRLLLGLPLYTTTAIPDGTVWGISKADVFVVMRQDVEVATSSGGSTFAADSTDIRGVMRVAPGFPRLDSIVKLYDAA